MTTGHYPGVAAGAVHRSESLDQGPVVLIGRESEDG